MSQKTIFRCDVCGAEKKEANHWFIGFEVERSLSEPENLRIEPWEWARAELTYAIHLCGSQCVQKRVQEFLSKQHSGVEAA